VPAATSARSHSASSSFSEASELAKDELPGVIHNHHRSGRRGLILPRQLLRKRAEMSADVNQRGPLIPELNFYARGIFADSFSRDLRQGRKLLGWDVLQANRRRFSRHIDIVGDVRKPNPTKLFDNTRDSDAGLLNRTVNSAASSAPGSAANGLP
jgi:hypothetical protein